jgi:hypothetical protein
VALSRLYSGTDLECLSEQDQAIRTSLERRISGYYGVHYEFNMSPDAVGAGGSSVAFPGIRTSAFPSNSSAANRILVTQADNVILIKFSLSAVENPITVIQEPTRFRVVELTERHRRIARIIGGPGPGVPASAKQDVLTAIAGLSSQVTVHSCHRWSGEGHRQLRPITLLRTPAPRGHRLPLGIVRQAAGDMAHTSSPVPACRNIADVGGTRMQNPGTWPGR